jgi:hypothetical protein
MRRLAGCVIALATLVATAAPARMSCDAACLSGLAGRFMTALVAGNGAIPTWSDYVHLPDPGLRFAEIVHYAENSVPMMIGDGVWAASTGKTAAPLVLTDTGTGRAAWIGSIDEHGQPAFYAMTMRTLGGRIAAVESLIRRKEGRPPYGDPAGFAHDPAFAATVAPKARAPREAMIALARAYLASQAGEGAAPPFDSRCRLVENGVIMTGNLPAAKGETGRCADAHSRRLFQEFEAVRSRIELVDEARGVVVALGFRDLPGVTPRFTAADGKSYLAEANFPRTVQFLTLFKIDGGRIARIESYANEMPYLMPAPYAD